MKKTTPVSVAFIHNKSNHFLAQKQAVYEDLKSFPKTMLQVSRCTGIERANICRHIAALKKEDRVQLIRKGGCPISHFRAGFYSTDEAIFKVNGQLSLFAEGGALYHG